MEEIFKNKFFITGISLIVLFLIITILVQLKVTSNIDEMIIESIYKFRGSHSNHSGFFYWINRIITETGYLYALLPGCLITVILMKGNLKSLFLGLGTLITWCTNKIVKTIISRDRPNPIYHMMEEHSESFPSGHAMTSAFFYFFGAYLIHKSNLSNKLKKSLTAILIAMPFIISITRVNLSVHYLTDVLAGLLFGGSLVFFAIIIYEKLANKGYDGFKNLFTKNK